MSTESGVPGKARDKVKFEIYGEAMMEKTVKWSGNSGRVYPPPELGGAQSQNHKDGLKGVTDQWSRDQSTQKKVSDG